SPSGTGVKVWCRGRLPEHCRSRIKYHDGEVEAYDRPSGYFCATGHRLPDYPATINVSDTPIEILLQRVGLMKRHDVPAGGAARRSPLKGRACGNWVECRSDEVPDDEVIATATACPKSGSKFARLWRGDTSLHRGDDSAADLALCAYLAYYVGPDSERI